MDLVLEAFVKEVSIAVTEAVVETVTEKDTIVIRTKVGIGIDIVGIHYLILDLVQVEGIDDVNKQNVQNIFKMEKNAEGMEKIKIIIR